MTELFQCKPLRKDIKIPELRNGKFILKSSESGIINPGESKLVKTGLSFAFPNTYFAYIHAPERLLERSIMTLAGVADSDYRGEYCVVLINKGTEAFNYDEGDEVGYMHFVKIALPELVETENLQDTVRGESGWGSTGIN